METFVVEKLDLFLKSLMILSQKPFMYILSLKYNYIIGQRLFIASLG